MSSLFRINSKIFGSLSVLYSSCNLLIAASLNGSIGSRCDAFSLLVVCGAFSLLTVCGALAAFFVVLNILFMVLIIPFLFFFVFFCVPVIFFNLFLNIRIFLLYFFM